MNENKNNQRTDSINQFDIYHKAISFITTMVMCAFVVAPMIVSVYTIIDRNIDNTLSFHVTLVKDIIFPYGCMLLFATYCIPFFVGEKKITSIFGFLKANKIFVVFLLAVIWFFISQIYNAPEVIWIGWWDEWLGETFNMQVAYIIFIFFGATQIKDDHQKKIIFRVHMFSSLFVPIAGQVIWCNKLAVTSDSLWRFKAAVFPQHNNYGYYLTMTVILAGAMFCYETEKKWKLFALTTFVINSLAMSLNDTLGAWVGAAAAIIFLIISKLIAFKKIGWEPLLLIPIFIACIFIPAHLLGSWESNFSSLGTDIGKIVEGDDINAIGTGRGIIWKQAVETINDHKLLGIGFEGIFYKYMNCGYVNTRPHNEFLQYALFYGIPAALFYFLGCFGVFIRALRKKKYLTSGTLISLTTAFAYLVGSLFGLTLFSTAYFLFMFMGMGYVSDPVKKDNKTNEVHI